MTAGAHLAHAAEAAADAQRLLLASVLHVEAAEEVSPDLDEFVADVELPDTNVAFLLEKVGDYAAGLQRIADAYGHAEVRRRAGGRCVRGPGDRHSNPGAAGRVPPSENKGAA